MTDDWTKWIKGFERFHIASGLEMQVDEIQVNPLIYTIFQEAENILVSLQLTSEEANGYEMVKRRLDAHLASQKHT